MTTLAELLVAPTKEQVFNALLANYQAAGFPVTAWQPFGTERTRLMAMATAIVDFGAVYIPAIAGGSLLDYAPLYPGWTALTADQIYDLDQLPATFTAGNITASNTSNGAYNYTAASPLKLTFTVSGRSYLSTGGGTIPAAVGAVPGTAVISVRAEFAGSVYLEPSNSATATILLTTPLPGVSLSNPATQYNAVVHTGSGTGTVTPSGTPVGPHSLLVLITSTGQAGVATWSYALDGGTPVAAGPLTTLANIGGVGITVTLANGATNPSFAAGDTYLVSCPGSWITSQGSDLESDAALVERCRDRWASLAVVPTQGLYQLLATTTPDVGSQVTQCTVVPDAVINNKVNVIVSGPGGVLPTATIAAIQAYITPRARGCDNPIVQSPTTTPVTIAATVTVFVAQLATVQAAVVTSLQTYVAAIPVNGVVRIAEVVDAIMTIDGVVDCTGVTINGVAANLVLGSVSSFVLPVYPPTLTLSYVAV